VLTATIAAVKPSESVLIPIAIMDAIAIGNRGTWLERREVIIGRKGDHSMVHHHRQIFSKVITARELH